MDYLNTQGICLHPQGSLDPSERTTPRLQDGDPSPHSTNLRKRKRHNADDVIQQLSKISRRDPTSTYGNIQTHENTEKRMAHIEVPELAYPKSLYNCHEPSLRRSSEREILCEILNDTAAHDDGTGDFIEANLEQFCIYRPHRARRSQKSNTLVEATLANEMVALHEINSFSASNFYFDGIVFHGDKRYSLEKVPFNILSIGCYEDVERGTVGDDVWIQSIEGRRRDMWYRLRRPAPEYRRYHKTFLWMADLSKHIIDFSQAKSQVCLSDFRCSFSNWLSGTYQILDSVRNWLAMYGDHDFRRMITSQADFLYSQAIQIDSSYGKLPLWGEVYQRDLTAIKKHNELPLDDERWTVSEQQTHRRRRTTVTPYVFSCFQHLPWAPYLYKQSPRTARLKQNHLPFLPIDCRVTRGAQPDLESAHPAGRKPDRIAVNVGDVVSVKPDTSGAWRSEDSEWHAYVQGINHTVHGKELSLLWMYKPHDTACMRMRYPHENELFLSDHCNCGDGPIYSSEILRLTKVAFYGGPDAQPSEFFCRQQYKEADAAWITLDASHFLCRCKKASTNPSFGIGQTMLIKSGPSKATLEPVIIVKACSQDPGAVRVRRLLRRKTNFKVDSAPLNELVYTERIELVSMTRIERRCNIRFYCFDFRDMKAIPAPYNRGGTGDHYFICTKEKPDGKLENLALPWPSDLQQGWDPTELPYKPALRTLDIFCGGGNFARGLEEGGAISCGWAVDYSSQAIHTYKANLPDKSDIKLYYGSVNQYLSEALEENFCDGEIAKQGEVEVIIAGSPCQGFSLANPHKGSEEGLINESMVASVISFVDHYRPKYALLENVKGMAMGGENKNVLAAILCAIVGLGYQVRTFALDAWSFGSPQSRSRIFISCAAPGLPAMPEPLQTHDHPPEVMGGSLGRTANGLQTSARYRVPTSFPFVSAGESTKDLPPIGRGTYHVAYPDHRQSIPMSILNKICIEAIPRNPSGCGFLTAQARGLMPQVQLDNYVQNEIRSGTKSKSWSRVRQHRLFPTVMTVPHPADGVNGTTLHWQEHRLLTILEARRAQGFIDQEVIVGSTANQWRIIGNSVARPVALALGMALREAWLGMPTSEELDTRSTHSENRQFLGEKFHEANELHGTDDVSTAVSVNFNKSIMDTISRLSRAIHVKA